MPVSPSALLPLADAITLAVPFLLRACILTALLAEPSSESANSAETRTLEHASVAALQALRKVSSTCLTWSPKR
eukprot:CAMPEP_0177626522 /NCGR_PEP_ID=MMETSP0419_2-20121207/30699_1 /TAXON_ID=582737 /ORGANISM="Tetraselmis sp., Strain GSL018" /LENGTH=73 /DNA_ID=CAMNT_0019127583 /DNA_START=480 /DNA_END=701 /DNA_ORIENTATION=-